MSTEEERVRDRFRKEVKELSERKVTTMMTTRTLVISDAGAL